MLLPPIKLQSGPLEANASEVRELIDCIRFMNLKGWSPATSTNYSLRSCENKNEYLISRSGVDKSQFNQEDLIVINSSEEIAPPFNRAGVKSSAETQIHTFLYEKYPEINCILHTHSVLGTVLSMEYIKEKKIIFEGYEIQKGLEGNTTHEVKTILPIVHNSQKMTDILSEFKEHMALQENDGDSCTVHGFLIAGHGLYSWGKNMATVKRQIETFEFLFECLAAKRRL